MRGEYMTHDIKDLISAAYAKVAENSGNLSTELSLEIAGTFYAEAEERLAAYKETLEASDSTTGIKAKRAAFEPTKYQHDVTSAVMEEVRKVVHDAISEEPDASILIWDALNNYTTHAVKPFRDFQLAHVELDEDFTDSDDEEDVEEFDYTELETLRQQAENFYNMAGRPVVTDEEAFIARTKTNKSGTSLNWSRKPKSTGNGSEDSNEGGDNDKVTTYKLRYKVDGGLLQMNTTLTELALWCLSSRDWTVSVSDIKSAVCTTYNVEKYADVPNNYEAEVNGHTLERFREKVS